MAETKECTKLWIPSSLMFTIISAHCLRTLEQKSYSLQALAYFSKDKKPSPNRVRAVRLEVYYQIGVCGKVSSGDTGHF